MKEKIIMWGAIIGLAILLFLIPTKGNALTKDEIKEHQTHIDVNRVLRP